MAENKNPFSNLEAKFKTVDNNASKAPKEKKPIDYKKYTKSFIAIFSSFCLVHYRPCEYLCGKRRRI